MDLNLAVVRMLETGELPADLWADDVLVEGWVPVWRMQWRGRDQAKREFLAMHPEGEAVLVCCTTPTRDGGAVIELVVQTRDPSPVKSKLVAVVERGDDGRICEMRIHCTGDWTPAQESSIAAMSTLSRSEWLPRVDAVVS